VVGEIAVTVADRVEARLRAERGKQRRPDVRRNEVGVVSREAIVRASLPMLSS
jgi:hypothetical protein